MQVAPWTAFRSSALAALLALGAAQPAGAQVTRYSVPLATRRAATALPDPIADIVDRAARALGVHSAAKPPAGLLRIARDTLRDGSPAERGAAAMLLGYARARGDSGLLVEHLGDDDRGAAEQAMIALGNFGGVSARLHLHRILEDKRAKTRLKATAAVALGLVASADDASSGGDEIKAFAMELLRLSRTKHADELAACFIALGVDEGRAVLTEYLELNKTLVATTYSTNAASEGLLRGIALAALSRRYATDEEWILVRLGLGSQRSPMRRYLTAWGLERRGPNGLSKKLLKKAVRELIRRVDDRRPEVAAIALLALQKFDPKSALRRARSYLKQGYRPSPRNAAALLVLGRAGNNEDQERLQALNASVKDAEGTAAWCLAASALSRRLDKDAKPPAVGELPSYPIAQIRARLGGHLAPAGWPQAACAVALAQLGDESSVFRLREHFFRTGDENVRRAFALALLRLDPTALDRVGEPGKPSPQDAKRARLRLLGWSHASAPQLWAPLVTLLKSDATTAAERIQGLRLAGQAIAGVNRTLDGWLRGRVGDAPLPAAIAALTDWQKVGAGVNIEPIRR